MSASGGDQIAIEMIAVWLSFVGGCVVLVMMINAILGWAWRDQRRQNLEFSDLIRRKCEAGSLREQARRAEREANK